MKEISPFEGHLILYCKNNYDVLNVDFITGIQRIWAVRCGYDNDCIDDSSLEYIADKLYAIITKTLPDFDCIRLQKYLHKAIYCDLTDMPFNHKIIRAYRNKIMMLQCLNGDEILIQLPQTNKELFKRIVAGKGEYNDYELINK